MTQVKQSKESSTHLSIQYLDLSGTSTTGTHYQLKGSDDAELYASVLANPDMNATFQGNYTNLPDHFLACYFNGTFVGGILLHHHPHRHTALHLAIDRVNYKDTIHYFAELAVMYVQATGKIPMTLVPNNLRQMKFWMSHVIGIRPVLQRTQSVVFAGETSTDVAVYTLPDDWAPRYVNNVVFNWR